jgi:hypothetical protein
LQENRKDHGDYHRNFREFFLIVDDIEILGMQDDQETGTQEKNPLDLVQNGEVCPIIIQWPKSRPLQDFLVRFKNLLDFLDNHRYESVSQK